MVACFDLFPTILEIAGANHRNVIDGHDLSHYLTGKPGTHRLQKLLFHFPHDHRSTCFTLSYEGDDKLICNFANDRYELLNVVSDIGERTIWPRRILSAYRSIVE